jgi:hypothetical protein
MRHWPHGGARLWVRVCLSAQAASADSEPKGTRICPEPSRSEDCSHEPMSPADARAEFWYCVFES